MYDQAGNPYVRDVGARILKLLNGVKQTAAHFAALHNLDAEELQSVIRGEIAPTQAVCEAIAAHSPLRIRDLYSSEVAGKFPVPDDTKEGVVTCSPGQTRATLRTTRRGPDGMKVPFYDYADTAMSRTSLFRPEWIAERYVHNGTEPDSVPDWAFNHGHFEHQVTYFVGPVNFHWIAGGRKQVRAMQTGDVNYITPFVPHTFTTRVKGEGLILAVTYGGAIAAEGYQARIHQHGLEEFLNEVTRVADHTTPSETDELGGVMILRGSPSTELISRIPSQPYTRALRYRSPDTHIALGSAAVERWGYNLGDRAVELLWGHHSETIGPGGSFFARAGRSFVLQGAADVLVMEIAPDKGDPAAELSLIARYAGKAGIQRVHTENQQWF